MANELDELDTSLVNEAGQDVHVINKQLKVELDGADKFVNVGVWFLFIIGGVIYMFRKAHAKTYFQQLQQKLQHDASTIDNFMQQKVAILTNAAKLLDKSINLDKETFKAIAEARSGLSSNPDEARNQLQQNLDGIEHNINVVLEAYPELKSHQAIADVMQQNAYLQNEITAAREVYNDTVNRWNAAVYQRWAKKFVAAQSGYTTRIPFTASKEIKQQAEGVFF
jgi:LemA protein